MMSPALHETFDDEVERLLRAALESVEPPELRAAMNDAVFPGGARVRPRLCLAVARAAAGRATGLAEAAAAAVELIHCASLVHDDLPCFDDADTRRGRPSIQRRFGEAMAVLVGDALIVSAFERLAAAGAPASALLVLANAAGARNGLVSGQAYELSRHVVIERYHHAKTGALFEAATRLGAIAAGVDDQPFATLGRALGALYQLADDAADRFGDPRVLGKPTGQDEANGRPSAFLAASDRVKARETLVEAASALASAVPSCPKRADLGAFVTGVAWALIERSVGAGERRPPSSACRDTP